MIWDQTTKYSSDDEKYFQQDSYGLFDIENDKFFEICDYYRWNYQPRCPFCHSMKYSIEKYHYKCDDCSKSYNELTDTPFEGWQSEVIAICSVIEMYCIDNLQYLYDTEHEEWYQKLLVHLYEDLRPYFNYKIRSSILQLKWLIQQSKSKPMAKNIKTLRDHLFEQLERLSNADNESIDTEIKKTTAIIQVSEQILVTAQTEIEMVKSIQEMDVAIDFVEAKEAEHNKLPEHSEEDKEPEMYNPDTMDKDFAPIPLDKTGHYLTEEKRGVKYK